MFKLFFSKSVEVIMKDFHAVVAKLKAAEAHHRANAMALTGEAQDLLDQASAARSEADAAAQAAAKVQSLVS